MTTTITLQDANIIINGLSLEDLLSKVYNKGIEDGKNELPPAKVTLINLSKELQAQGRTISPRTLASKAKVANVKLCRFDGSKLAVLRKDIKHFLET